MKTENKLMDARKGNAGKVSTVESLHSVHKDIKLNLGVKSCIIRLAVTLFVPWVPFLIDKHYMVYAAPVMVYLLFTALTHFDPVKYLWHRVIRHEPDPDKCQWAKDLNIEVDHL